MMAVDERVSVALWESVLFVDAENAGTIDLSAISNGVLVRFFFGASQKKVSTEFLRAAIKLGDRFSDTDVDGAGNKPWTSTSRSISASTSLPIRKRAASFSPRTKDLIRW
jgi:hypothetical protein